MSERRGWDVLTDARILRRLGKTQEELSELQKVLARCILQGLDGQDPVTGRRNSHELEDETADVIAQCMCNIESLCLNEQTISERVKVKVEKMREWEKVK